MRSPDGRVRSFDRRAFLAGGALLLACRGRETREDGETDAADAGAPTDTATGTDARPTTGIERAPFALFEAYPALAEHLPRTALGVFPSKVERARTLLGGERLYVKRDDDFARAPSCPPSFAPAQLYGGGKVRKLELILGEARAQSKKRLVTFGGVGSNQAVAAAILGRALGFEVHLYLAPQPPSTLVATNLAAMVAARAEVRVFSSVMAAQAEARRTFPPTSDVYLVPPGATTPLGTLGFVNAGLELAGDVRAGGLPEPARIYLALGLGGSAAGLALGCALGGLASEIVAVRASNATTVTDATLRSIHAQTIAFARARDARFPAVSYEQLHLRIEPRFLGAGYGRPTAEGDAALARARAEEGWSLDPVYTGKVMAALLDDVGAPVLFWNTMSSRPLDAVPLPTELQRFTR